MEHEIKIRQNSGSLQVTIPAALCKWLELKDGDILTVQDEVGKHGKYFSTWKKKNEQPKTDQRNVPLLPNEQTTRKDQRNNRGNNTMLKTIQEELERLSKKEIKVSIYITPDFIPVGIIESVQQDFIRIRDTLSTKDNSVTIPIENIKYIRERK